MNNLEEIIDDLKKISEEKLDYSVDKIIIYGSRAKNTHQPGSDIDVILIGHGFENKGLLEREVEYETEWGKTDYPELDIKPMTPKEYKKAEQKEHWLVEEATKTGRILKP